MTPTTEPSTRAPAVLATATVLRPLAGEQFVHDGEQLVWRLRVPIAVIDFYPATHPNHRHRKD